MKNPSHVQAPVGAVKTLRSGYRMDAPRVSASWSKRGFDILLSATFILVTFPVILLLGLMVRLETEGPAFVKIRQVGLNGKAFPLYRFRVTSKVPTNGRNAVRAGYRFTGMGRFLCTTGLDTMPQIINVFLGDMSFVGPRPHDDTRDHMYAHSLPHYEQRFLAVPGLTGLAQIHGFDGRIQAKAEMQKQLEYDIEYIETWSFWLDIKTLLKALVVIFRTDSTN